MWVLLLYVVPLNFIPESLITCSNARLKSWQVRAPPCLNPTDVSNPFSTMLQSLALPPSLTTYIKLLGQHSTGMLEDLPHTTQHSTLDMTINLTYIFWRHTVGALTLLTVVSFGTMITVLSVQACCSYYTYGNWSFMV
jgi:hypothetical protein